MKDVDYAFPQTAIVGAEIVTTGGMTLRDYFAGQALVGILSGNLKETSPSLNIEQWAYLTADAMMEVRKN